MVVGVVAFTRSCRAVDEPDAERDLRASCRGLARLSPLWGFTLWSLIVDCDY